MPSERVSRERWGPQIHDLRRVAVINRQLSYQRSTSHEGGTRPSFASKTDLHLADMAVLCTIGAVVGLFLVSPVTLEANHISYMTSGGGFFSKFHPSTFLAGIALALRCLASNRPLRTGWRLLTSDIGVLLLLAGVIVTMFSAVFIAKTPFTPPIDTFILPIIVFLLLRDLDPTIVRWLALCIALIMCLNAVIGISEFLSGRHLVSIDVPAGSSADPTRSDVTFDWRAELALDWRATALLGHPLSNGLIVGSFILCLAAPGAVWIPAGIKLPILLLQVVSMFAFGARTAMVFSYAFAIWLGVTQSVEMISRGSRLQTRPLAIAVITIGTVMTSAIIIYHAGFLDRTIERFQMDYGSSATRVTMFNLFQPISWSDLIFGPNQDVVATWQRVEGLEFGIESSWIGLVLTYGVFVTAMLLIGLAAFFWSLVRTCGRGTFLVLVFNFILVSVSANMSGKTITFAMIVSLIMVFLKPGQRMCPIGDPPSFGSV